MLTDYERLREEKMKENRAMLAQLGLEQCAPAPVRQHEPARKARTKTMARNQNLQDGHIVRKRKALVSAVKADANRRTSKRLRRQKQSYREYRSGDEASSDSNFSASESDGDEDDNYHRGSHSANAFGISRRTANGRYVAHINRNFDRPDPKIFGHQKHIKVGHWWATRLECSRDGVHAPTVAGISGNSKVGCWSVAVSGGYEDDVDEGFRFTFTGSGGRDLKGTKNNPKNLRTAPQSKNQELSGLNLALKVSCDTGKPVRVIRGYKGSGRWAPEEGYRYDGLYQVKKWWWDTGLSGFKVLKYAFKRIDGQPPIDTAAGPEHQPIYGDESESQDIAQDQVCSELESPPKSRKISRDKSNSYSELDETDEDKNDQNDEKEDLNCTVAEESMSNRDDIINCNQDETKAAGNMQPIVLVKTKSEEETISHLQVFVAIRN